MDKIEGFNTVLRALKLLIEETKKKHAETIKDRDNSVSELTAMIIHKKTEIAKITHEITELEAKKTQISRPFDDKLATLDTEIGKAEETRLAIEMNISKLTETERKSDLCEPQPEPPAEPTPVETEETDKKPKTKKKAFGVGQHNRPTVSSKITGIIEKLLDEGRWETNKNISEALIKSGYPPKHTMLYASKGVNVLKWQGKAVSYSVGNKVYWRSTKYPDLPIPKTNGGK